MIRMYIYMYFLLYIYTRRYYIYIYLYIYIYMFLECIYINILEFCKPLIGRCDSQSYPTSSHFPNPEIPNKLKFWQYLCMYICVYMYTHINRAAIKRNYVFTYLFLFYTDFQHQTSYIYIKLSYIYSIDEYMFIYITVYICLFIYIYRYTYIYTYVYIYMWFSNLEFSEQWVYVCLGLLHSNLLMTDLRLCHNCELIDGADTKKQHYVLVIYVLNSRYENLLTYLYICIYNTNVIYIDIYIYKTVIGWLQVEFARVSLEGCGWLCSCSSKIYIYI